MCLLEKHLPVSFNNGLLLKGGVCQAVALTEHRKHMCGPDETSYKGNFSAIHLLPLNKVPFLFVVVEVTVLHLEYVGTAFVSFFVIIIAQVFLVSSVK